MKNFLTLLFLTVALQFVKSQTINSINPNTTLFGTNVSTVITGQGTIFNTTSPVGNVFGVSIQQMGSVLNASSYSILSDTTISANFAVPLSISTCYYDVVVNTVAQGTLTMPGGFLITPCNGGCTAFYSLYPDTALAQTWWAVNLSSGTAPVSYFWQWGDGNTSFGATPSHTYANPGFYNICLTISDGGGCVNTYCDSSTYIFRTSSAVATVNVILPTTDVSDRSTEETAIYPNPAKGKITVKAEEQIKEVKVFNVHGKVVFTSSSGELFANSMNIDVSQFPNGIYFIQYKTQTKTTNSKFLISR